MRLLIAIVLAGAACNNSQPGQPGHVDGASGSGNKDAAIADASSSSGDGGNDPFAAARATCIAKINTLRATKGRTAYTRWTAVESCVDQEVTSDATSGQAHAAWLSGQYSCNGNGQNECEGQGASGIESCLDQMWNEKDQPECAGCDACADAYNPNCTNCDFFGMTTGHVCGHYVNMSANYFTMAACGFSSLGGWDAINFE